MIWDVPTIFNPKGLLGEPLMVQDAQEHVVSGAAGLRALAVLLARPNAGGASRQQVQAAVKRIDRARTAEAFLATAEDETRRMGVGYRDIWHMPLEIRLAMEMAAHEDAERRALEGELVDLERHWREAEELAAIADALPLAPGVEEKLDDLRSARSRVEAIGNEREIALHGAHVAVRRSRWASQYCRGTPARVRCEP